MGELGENKFIFSLNKRIFYFVVGILCVLILISLASIFSRIARENIYAKIPVCGDGSFPGTCSLNKPYYCGEKGVLVYDSDVCGCPEGFSKADGKCASKYGLTEKEVSLKYIFSGEEKEINFVVYDEMDNYLSGLSQSIIYSEGESSSRADFKIKKMDEKIQREFLMPLVAEIQNLDLDKDDQARIAISLVQHIPFGESNESYNFGGNKIPYSRYPYQVLYDYKGICGEKTELLSFLLREIGYGVAFFYYIDENHESLGIKCPVYESFSSTGYCFVETTAPSVITDNKINYVGTGKLNSVPELFFISEGLTFGENNFYEKHDAKKLIRIRNAVEKRGWLGPLRKIAYENLKEKYGLVDEYYGG